MSTEYATATLIRPDEEFAPPASERVAVGERVSEMVNSEAWSDLKRGVRGKQAAISSQLMARPGTEDKGVFTKELGEMVGVGAIEVVAAELIAEGERAADEIKAREAGV